jgi:hypothetical protein
MGARNRCGKDWKFERVTEKVGERKAWNISFTELTGWMGRNCQNVSESGRRGEERNDREMM